MTPRTPRPVSLAELTDAYEETAQAVLGLAREITPEQAGWPTDCPGWTVFDQIAHVESVEALVSGEPVPEVDIAGLAHVRSAMGAVIEKYLEPRRSRSLVEVLSALEGHLGARLAMLRAPDATAETPVLGPFGPTTYAALLAVRTFDIWVHEQDLREALDRPGGLEGAPAANAVARIVSAFPRTVARGAGLPVGSRVGLVVEGAAGARALAAVVEGEDGRPRGVAIESTPIEATAIEATAIGAAGSTGVDTTVITMSTRDATRLAAGRRRPDDIDADVDGDLDVARAVLAHFTITP